MIKTQRTYIPHVISIYSKLSSFLGGQSNHWYFLKKMFLNKLYKNKENNTVISRERQIEIKKIKPQYFQESGLTVVKNKGNGT